MRTFKFVNPFDLTEIEAIRDVPLKMFKFTVVELEGITPVEVRTETAHGIEELASNLLTLRGGEDSYFQLYARKSETEDQFYGQTEPIAGFLTLNEEDSIEIFSEEDLPELCKILHQDSNIDYSATLQTHGIAWDTDVMDFIIERPEND